MTHSQAGRVFPIVAAFLSIPALALVLASSVSVAFAQGRMSPEEQKAQFEKHVDALSVELSLSDEQRVEVRAILEKEQEQRRDLMRQMRQGQRPGAGREGMRTRMQELNRETETALAAVLSAGQMTKYAAFVAERRQTESMGRRGARRTNPQDGN